MINKITDLSKYTETKKVQAGALPRSGDVSVLRKLLRTGVLNGYKVDSVETYADGRTYYV